MMNPNLPFDTIDLPGPIQKQLGILAKNIDLQKRSQKGACGWLFFGRNRIHNQEVAIKFYDWSDDLQYHAEPTHLGALDSENIIRVYGASFVDEDYAYFETPYFKNGDLDAEISNGVRGNLRAIAVVRDILSGLSHLHANNLVHRDLKPQNILIADNQKAVIGDFGSVKRIPEGSSSVPGSGHSLIYRPPESVNTGQYRVAGDFYQVGVILFQLLGGYFPYDESGWLNNRDRKKYRLITDFIDKQLFAADIIKNRISRGNIIDTSTLPPWVCDPLKRTISKACNKDPQKRYESCADLLAHLGKIRGNIHNWSLESGIPIYRGNDEFRIVKDKSDDLFVQKNKGAGWRKSPSFNGSTIAELVHEIEQNNR